MTNLRASQTNPDQTNPDQTNSDQAPRNQAALNRTTPADQTAQPTPAKPVKTLVVHYHPRQDSLCKAATDRVLAGLRTSGHPVRVLDLASNFDPVLSIEEWQGHVSDEPSDRGNLGEHIEALRWADKLVLVYPTWFGGQPAAVKGWFDRVWMNGVAWELPEGKNLLRGLLKNVRNIDVVTTHGSSRIINFLQGNPGRITIFRGMRLMCHWRCRTTWIALYRLDDQSPDTISEWLERVEAHYR